MGLVGIAAVLLWGLRFRLGFDDFMWEFVVTVGLSSRVKRYSKLSKVRFCSGLGIFRPVPR